MVNIGMIIGNLTKDPELRYMNTANGQMAKCRFAVAVNDGYGENATAIYFNISCWGKLAESCEKNLSKGKKVAVVGKMMPGRYQNKEGQWVNSFEIMANNIEFLSPKDSATKQDPKPQASEQTQLPPGFEQFAATEDVPF